MLSPETALYEEFLEARRVAIDLTDAFDRTDVNDPGRDAIWERVRRQTEFARRLLDAWLGVSGVCPERPVPSLGWPLSRSGAVHLSASDRATRSSQPSAADLSALTSLESFAAAPTA